MSTGTTLDGKPVQGPNVTFSPGNPAGIQNPGDSVSIMGVCLAVSGIDITGTATVQLKSSQVSISIPLSDVRGHRVHALPAVGDQTVSKGTVTAVTGSGPTAQLSVKLSNSQQTIVVSAYDVYATQSL